MPGVIAGFYGKLPARGDFVRNGLPRDFTDPWDAWLSRVITGSRGRMGEGWLPAFLESPVWRFVLAQGLCGERTAVGLMLPSVDRAGRYFPLTFAALLGRDAAATDPAWLDRCEAAGRAALEQDAAPDQIAGMLGAAGDATGSDSWSVWGEGEGSGQSLWWTDGAPRVAATRFAISGMPNACVYATMLGAAAADDQAAEAVQTTREWDPVPDTPAGRDPLEPPS